MRQSRNNSVKELCKTVTNKSNVSPSLDDSIPGILTEVVRVCKYAADRLCHFPECDYAHDQWMVSS